MKQLFQSERFKTILKVAFSLCLATGLIYYFYNKISEPKEAVILPEKQALISDIATPFIKNDSYCLVGDTLFIDSKGQCCIAETEAFYSLGTQLQKNDENQLVYGTYRIDMMRIMKKVFANAAWFWIAMSLLVSFTSHFLRSLRWRMLLQPLGYEPKVHNTFFAVMIMYLANMAVPRLGEVLRCTFISRYENIPMEKSLGTMLTERLVDMVSLLLLAAVMFVTQYTLISSYVQKEFFKSESTTGSPSYKLILLGIAIIVCVVLGIVFYKKITTATEGPFAKIREVAKGLLAGISSIRHVKNKPLFVLYSASIWICYVFVIYFCFKAVPETASQSIGAAITCLFFGSLAIVAVQGGLGIYPIAMSKILFLYGVQESIGYAYGWLSWVIQTLMVLLLGFISLLLMPAMNKKNES